MEGKLSPRIQILFRIAGLFALLVSLPFISRCGKTPEAPQSPSTQRRFQDKGKIACITGNKAVLLFNRKALEKSLTKYISGTGPEGCPLATEPLRLGCFTADGSDDIVADANAQGKRKFLESCYKDGHPLPGVNEYYPTFKTGSHPTCSPCEECSDDDEPLVAGKPKVGCFKKR